MIWKSLFTIHTLLYAGTSHVKAKHVKLEEPISIVFAGDISFEGHEQYHVQHGYHSYNDTFHRIAPYIREADVAVVSFESPFVTKETIHKAKEGGKPVIPKADAESASSLSYAGFDLVTLANNHMNDYGEDPVNFTVQSFKNVGIKAFGINYGPTDSPQTPVIIRVKGLRIGFLGYCYVTHCKEVRGRYNAGPAIYRDDIAARDITNLKPLVDIIVVYMHWGKEFYMQPMNSQQRIAKELRSLGSHVIIGSHSHVLQPHCYHDSDVVAFSLGNFQYAWFVPGGNMFFVENKNDKHLIEFYEKSVSSCLPPTKESRLFRVRVGKKGVLKADYLPLSIEYQPSNKCLQPEPLKEAEWIQVCGPEDNACIKCP